MGGMNSRSTRQVIVSLISLFLVLMPVHGQARLSADEAEKLVIQKPEPVYPELAKQTKLQGTVKIDVTVSELGTVASARLISGHPLLVTAGLDAAKKRKYKAYLVNDKPTSFVTTIEISFSLGIPKDEYEKQQNKTNQYFREEGKCRDLLNSHKWEGAEEVCKTAVLLADQLGAHQGLMKMDAYEHMGHALLARSYYREALEYYSRAFEFARSSLKETDAELGYAYRNLGVANHGLGNINKARELYGKAENILQFAHKNIGSEDLKERYQKTLKEILKYHLLAAEQAGAGAEAEEVRKRLSVLP